MSEELSTLLQVLQLYGRGLDGLGKAIRFTARNVKKGVDFASLKKMQIKMKLHYASVGNHKTMKLKDLEKMTGGKYSIYNIPIEDEKMLVQFYDSLKKVKVSFAELPDLQLGDGYTQIAFNPLDADKLEVVVNSYRQKLAKEAKEISLDEYISTAGREGEELLTELAAKGYIDNMHEEQFAEIQDKLKSKEHRPISINLDSLLVREEKESYIFRLPGSLHNGHDGMCIRILKADVLLLDEGKTVVTALSKDSNIKLFVVDDRGIPIESSIFECKADKIFDRYDKIGKDRIKDIAKLKSNIPEIFPNFNKGQDSTMIEANLPFSMDRTKERVVTPTDKIANILSLEHFKQMSLDENFFKLDIDMDTSLISENEDFYIVNVPGRLEEKNDLIDCLTIPKSEARLDDSGKRIFTFLNKNDMSKIHSFRADGSKVKTFSKSNLDIATAFLKAEHEKSFGKQKRFVQGLEKKNVLDEVVKKR